MTPQDNNAASVPQQSLASDIASIPTRPPRLHHLDGFRFIVALWLVVAHNYDPEASPSGLLLERFCWRRYFAVSFFLVLSGFVSQYAYGGRNFEQPGVLRKFYFGRIGSVLACYYATMAASLILKAASPDYIFADKGTRWQVGLALVLTLTQTWVPGYAYFGNAPAWTLATLVAHWAAFPLLQRWLLRAEDRMVRAVAIGLPVLACVPVCIALLVQGGSLPGRQWYLFYTHPVLRFPDFVYGAALSEVFVRKIKSDSNTENSGGNIIEGQKQKPWQKVSLPFLADLIFPAIFTLILAVPYYGRSSAFDSVMIYAPMHLFGILIFGTSIDPSRSCTARVFSLEPCRKLGDFAFQVYLWWSPVFGVVRWVQDGYYSGGWMYLSPAYFFPACIILYLLAYVWYRFVDDPIRRSLTSVNKQSEKAATEMPTRTGRNEVDNTVTDAQSYHQVV